MGRPSGDDVREAVGRCPRCSVALAEAEMMEGEFLEKVAPRLLPDLHRRLGEAGTDDERSPWYAFPLPRLAGAVAAAVVIALVVLVPVWKEHRVKNRRPVAGQQGETVDPDYLGTKGHASIRLVVKRGDMRFWFWPGVPLLPGDAVRLIPYAPEHRYVLVVNRDSTGRVQVVYPFGGTSSAPLPEPGEPLEGSLILDEVPGEEQLFALFSDRPLEAPDAVVWLARQNGSAVGATSHVGGQSIGVVHLTLNKEVALP